MSISPDPWPLNAVDPVRAALGAVDPSYPIPPPADATTGLLEAARAYRRAVDAYNEMQNARLSDAAYRARDALCAAALAATASEVGR